MTRYLKRSLATLIVCIAALFVASDTNADGWSRCGMGWCPTFGFVPSTVSGLVLWLRADSGITLNGNTVSAWNDKSATGNNASQGTAANQPLFNPNDPFFGYQPTVSFNGTTATMAFSKLSPLVAPCTVMFCGSAQNGSGTQGDILEDGDSTEFVVSGPTEQYITFAGAAIVATVQQSTPTAVAAIFNGASSSIYQNTSVAASVTGNNGAGAVGGAGIQLGASTGLGNFFQGTIAEIAVYNHALTSAQIGAYFRYCATRYSNTWQ